MHNNIVVTSIDCLRPV